MREHPSRRFAVRMVEARSIERLGYQVIPYSGALPSRADHSTVELTG